MKLKGIAPQFLFYIPSFHNSCVKKINIARTRWLKFVLAYATIRKAKEIVFKKFSEFGMNVEPEMIDFENDVCCYTDHFGNMYKIFQPLD